ncbi:hypothetical protein RchiOBHm_Chr4g0396971 [Rosa chinensis]|uniref:Uncharacterized protein n=1 Tax=Rosa chinensis TaxID=74649 RepID=A0A2P6QRY3_ROSCH|nr:hypothetical protein RchiOBHm_Chr4g0396971 [Rosa chinensis]
MTGQNFHTLLFILLLFICNVLTLLFTLLLFIFTVLTLLFIFTRLIRPACFSFLRRPPSTDPAPPRSHHLVRPLCGVSQPRRCPQAEIEATPRSPHLVRPLSGVSRPRRCPQAEIEATPWRLFLFSLRRCHHVWVWAELAQALAGQGKCHPLALFLDRSQESSSFARSSFCW